ncbi:M48 family metalloprotease [Acidithiobacillus caldus]|uniref:M48 family metalloprotease n=1 Tax=Acidithiobacillus caldus TaxID=33059 RepID=UPI0007DA3AB2|nr:M48 family metalloprotease [Acidithiobacillus caldus]QER44283.1 hypothetical protein F0726_01209 [Acidithiobacillus caldus]
MRTNSDLKVLLDTLGCRAPIRFSRFLQKSEGICIPFLGIFIHEKYQNEAVPDPYLRAVVYHEVGHWRDPVHWLSLLAVPVLLFTVVGMLSSNSVPEALLWVTAIQAVVLAGVLVSTWRERRADAFARRNMPGYDRYDWVYTGPE